MDWVRRGNDLRCRRAGWPRDASSHRPRDLRHRSPDRPSARSCATDAIPVLPRCRPEGLTRRACADVIGANDRMASSVPMLGACFRPIARTGLPFFVGREIRCGPIGIPSAAGLTGSAQPDGRSILRCDDETVPAPARAGRSASCPTSRRSRIPGCPRRDRAGPVREAGRKRISSMAAFRRGAWTGSRTAAAGPARATGRG